MNMKQDVRPKSFVTSACKIWYGSLAWRATCKSRCREAYNYEHMVDDDHGHSHRPLKKSSKIDLAMITRRM